jgi:phosphoglycolate phosphatase
MNKRLAIFDLDGTLLDTVADLANATNQALAKCGYPTHPTEAYYHFVGNGINKLFARALPQEECTEENVLRIREHFIPYYNEHNADDSRPYPGIVALLSELQAHGVQLAVASNKYQQATAKLVSHFFPHIPFAAVYGQREGVAIKPDPTIVNDILSLTGISRADTIYIGDSGVDMLTAHNAAVESIGVTWGFRDEEELSAHGANHIVHHAEEIAGLIL